MSKVKATEILKKKLFNNSIRFVEFKYVYNFDSKLEFCSDSFDIICTSHDLKLVWSIVVIFGYESDDDNKRFCRLKKIKLTSCNKKIHGNFVVRGEGLSSTKISIDTNCLPLEEKNYGFSSEILQCKDGGAMTFIAEVYREDESFNFVIEHHTRLFGSKSSCDVTFVFDGEDILTNKLILSSQSEVFAAMFDSDMSEKATGRVEITDVEPSTFRQMLNFIYCGKVETSNIDELIKLILAADKYSLKSLVDSCAFDISCNLTVDNVIDVLITADRVSAEFLKKDCISMIVEKMKQISCTENFKKFRKSHTDLVCQIFDCIVENNSMYDPLNRVTKIMTFTRARPLHIS